jgi:hypothetical protein
LVRWTRAVVAALLLGGLLLLVRDEVRLDLRHEDTRATVVDTFIQYRGPDGAVVRFQADGQTVQARVEQPWFGDRPSTGQTIAVEYDPRNPARARRAGTHDLVAVGVPVALAGAFGVVWWRRWRGSPTGRGRA